MSFFRIPRHPEDDNWAYSVNGVGGTMITLRPGGTNDTTVLCTFLKEDAAVDGESSLERKALLLQALKGRGTIADRICSELDTIQEFYFGPMSQVQASTWSNKRFVLLGDAAYCPTPFTGQGTALSLVGAYVLAGEIKRNGSFSKAFDAYEALLRPYVETSQRQLSPHAIRFLHMKSGFGISCLYSLQRFFASNVVQGLLKQSKAKGEQHASKEVILPDYG